jgi:hypothetical protein
VTILREEFQALGCRAIAEQVSKAVQGEQGAVPGSDLDGNECKLFPNIQLHELDTWLLDPPRHDEAVRFCGERSKID